MKSLSHTDVKLQGKGVALSRQLVALLMGLWNVKWICHTVAIPSAHPRQVELT